MLSKMKWQRQKWQKWLKRNWAMVEMVEIAIAGCISPIFSALIYLTFWLFWGRNCPKLVLMCGWSKRARRELRRMGKDAVPILRKVFSLPPLSAAWRGLDAWDFAIRELGRLKATEALPELLEALTYPEPSLRALAAWALGEIGDPQAVPAIIPLLGDFRFVKVRIPEQAQPHSKIADDSENLRGVFAEVRYFASEALTKLGESEVVSAFEKVLERRDKDAVEFLRSHPYRKAIVGAFLEVLNHWGNKLTKATNAAWALGELRAVEALPKLSKLTDWLIPKTLRQICQEVVAKLKPLQFLPMPAVLTEIDKSGLPSPANPAAFSTETLPRSVSIPANGKGGEGDEGR